MQSLSMELGLSNMLIRLVILLETILKMGVCKLGRFLILWSVAIIVGMPSKKKIKFREGNQWSRSILKAKELKIKSVGIVFFMLERN